MNRFFEILLVSVVTLLACSASGLSQAQEAEIQYSWGTVKSLTSEQLAVTEYNYENNQEISVTYTVDAETVFNNVQSISEIKVGDSVEIDFVVMEGKNIAKTITVEKALESEKKEEALPSETSEQTTESPAVEEEPAVGTESEPAAESEPEVGTEPKPAEEAEPEPAENIY